jgi:Ca-activated chloride channel family protein
VAVTFAHPDLLWLLLGVLLLAAVPFGASWWRQRATARFGTPEQVKSLIVGRSGPLRAARAVLMVLSLLCVVLALAAPQCGSRTRILRRRGIDVVIALDFSKSMLARDVRPNRIERAKAEVIRFVEELDGDRVGIVAFAGETIEFPMTVDYAALTLFFRDLGPYDMPVGGTAIARALVAARRMMDRAAGRDANPAAGGEPSETPTTTRSRVVILMTDGEDHEGDPLAVAREYGEAGIRLYTVGIGSRTPEMIPTYAPDGTPTGFLRDDAGNPITTSLTEENETQLREMAEATGGSYFAAGRGGVGIDQIRAEIRRMHQEEVRASRVTVHEGRYALILFPAFLLLVLEALLPDAWVGRRRKKKSEEEEAQEAA